jgi:hypothetical protein
LSPIHGLTACEPLVWWVVCGALMPALGAVVAGLKELIHSAMAHDRPTTEDPAGALRRVADSL